jgi:hypothetical protein
LLGVLDGEFDPIDGDSRLVGHFEFERCGPGLNFSLTQIQNLSHDLRRHKFSQWRLSAAAESARLSGPRRVSRKTTRAIQTATATNNTKTRSDRVTDRPNQTFTLSVTNVRPMAATAMKLETSPMVRALSV